MPSEQKSKPKYDFRTCLKKSEVLKPEVLKNWLAEHPDQSPADDASQLVRENLLTEWQAKYLLSGRYRLHLGNYQLLKRIRRDEFGDRFVAHHPQLGRTVQVQVLPVELTTDPKQRSEFLMKAGLAGELDHPNLAHVFDIDKQQGRYYMVTEHSPGKSIAELPTNSLQANEIARIVREAISGLQFAHSRSVVHGNLSMDNVLIDDDGTVKISQLALSPLVDSATAAPKENVTPEQGDLLTIVRMGRRLLNHIEPSETTRQLSAHLSTLNTKDSDAFASGLVQLENWIEQRPVTETIESVPAERVQIVSPTPEMVVPDEETKRISKNAPIKQGHGSNRRRQSRQPDAFSNKKTFGPGSLAILVGLIGLVGYFTYRGFQRSSESRKPLEQPSAMRDASEQVASTKVDEGNLAAQPDSTAKPETSTGSPDDPQIDRAPMRSLFPSAYDSMEDESQNASESDPIDQPAVSETDQSDDISTSSKPSTRAQEKPSLDPMPRESAKLAQKKSESSLVPEEQQAADKAETIDTEKATEKGSDQESESSGPFDEFPIAADLPTTDSTDEVVLAEIQQTSIHLLGLEIRSPEGIGKGRTNFDLKRSETNKQQWSLIAKKTPKSNGDRIGQFDFDKPTGAIKFRWLPAAADSKIANYVRNCVIKLTLANESRTLALRMPLPLPDLKLTREKPFAQLDSAIEWLPNPELIIVELLPTKSAGIPKTWLEPAIVQPGTPSAIHFHEAISNRFMWLQLVTDVRKQATFDLRLMLKHADGTVQPIARSDDLKKLAELLRGVAATAQQEYLANKDLVAPYGQKTKFKDYVAKLKSTATKTQKHSEIAVENIAIIENFYDKVIPLRVIFRSDDHQVVLVDTAPGADEEDSKK